MNGDEGIIGDEEWGQMWVKEGGNKEQREQTRKEKKKMIKYLFFTKVRAGDEWQWLVEEADWTQTFVYIFLVISLKKNKSREISNLNSFEKKNLFPFCRFLFK